ncbi:MAG TPA: site-specific DNA-methyltransferase [Hungateiclostridium thermocellum]|uniref:Methyltransferase n=1 Tax=Acetivibrio thermocellus (strain ATCC 27405 / DSM 1237 / JCM 9322 / NBRC 103400 / NCIMB 10682 / NRRL B-4536 / VPI 7372) TaxID=203119 RepID=A3DFL0_ACET2|nr:DNA methyltransferase [Acetivibrio thermocellus]CDG36177.1 DNA methylase N-4/N-6 [Acetivibrio thermocellus BC1]ABN52739.1 DNA methylase N-4/N-6 domain protein [Acetivibrio thermocellus ATCC 27405]NLU27294.1 methyltransferase domain-containing protein [Acetivibrio thermocellus]THJ76652.1 site-specific DNA-methyltransferase [Acetivibrio thermocellus]UWV46266.1 DNA methyltransferase [Acetivibrio thermocellus]
MGRKVKCLYCGEEYTRTQYPEHLEKNHKDEYFRLIEKIKSDIESDFSIKDTAANNDVTCAFVKKVAKESTICLEEKSKSYFADKLNIKSWEPENFNLETTTVWSFPDRGDWATHSGKYRGNWSPFIPRNVILRYSKEGETVLDQFVGSGTTLVEAKLLKRKGIGVDINPEAVNLTCRNINFEKEDCGETEVHVGDARHLGFIKDESVDLICTHPPYSNIIKYSEDIEGDLSHCDINEFLVEMEKVAKESYRVLKKGRFCAILIGDTRRKGHMIPIGFNVMQTFLRAGFKLKEIVIKEQHNCSSTGYWRNQSIKYNFLLIAHEYLFIFRK